MAPPKAMPAEPEDNRGMSRWEEAVSPGGPSQWDVPSQFGSPIQNSDDMSMGGVSAIAAKPSRRGERSSQRAGDAHFHASKPRPGSTLCTPSANPKSPPEPTPAANPIPPSLPCALARRSARDPTTGEARSAGRPPCSGWAAWQARPYTLNHKP